ncbi:hypothetical protein, partial [Klebsiella pneumoniae]|uniref:hypothetical protein n=1 Tax=Klebsiella pneumoniae TaxID=573 RepID=UPI0025A02797
KAATKAATKAAKKPGKKQPSTPTADLSKVVVTGISSSIESSIKVKENADNIVEAISAEDIGKLPDVS